ncbi:MAG: hypothetical protein ABSG53_15150 [Thermoguttaceae bacterium]|jgi:hypothetical protein
MDEQHSSFDCFPLFPRELDIWDSIDKPSQEKVLDCLALLLLQHLQQTTRCPGEEQPLTKGYST